MAYATSSQHFCHHWTNSSNPSRVSRLIVMTWYRVFLQWPSVLRNGPTIKTENVRIFSYSSTTPQREHEGTKNHPTSKLDPYHWPSVDPGSGPSVSVPSAGCRGCPDIFEAFLKSVLHHGLPNIKYMSEMHHVLRHSSPPSFPIHSKQTPHGDLQRMTSVTTVATWAKTLVSFLQPASGIVEDKAIAAMRSSEVPTNHRSSAYDLKGKLITVGNEWHTEYGDEDHMNILTTQEIWNKHAQNLLHVRNNLVNLRSNEGRIVKSHKNSRGGRPRKCAPT